MSKNTVESGLNRRKRYNERALNVFAVMFALFPIFSIGLFSYSLVNSENLFASDSRRANILAQTTSPATPRLFEEPLISVTFDDGWQSVYTDAAPIMSEYNIQSTQYILPGLYDSHDYISLDQAKSLKKSGHEIAAHTMTHANLTTLSQEQVTYQLSESKSSLIKDGLINKDIHFAAPYTANNSSVSKSIEKYYASNRNTYADLSNGVDEYDINTPKAEFDKFEIIGFSVKNTTTTAELKAAIDYARAHNGWLVLVYHQIDDSNTEYSVTRDVFAQQMKLVKSSNLKIATLGSVLESRRISNE